MNALKEIPQKTVADVKEITLNKSSREIVVTISAKGSIYVQEPDGIGFPQFMNAGPLVEGLNLLLKYNYHAVQAMKNCKDFNKLRKENDELRAKIAMMADFENGGKVTINGLTYQKAINEHSFYTHLKQSLNL